MNKVSNKFHPLIFNNNAVSTLSVSLNELETCFLRSKLRGSKNLYEQKELWSSVNTIVAGTG